MPSKKMCPICSSAHISVKFIKLDPYELSKCSQCGFLWVDNLIASMVYDEYGEYLFSQTTLTEQTKSNERHWGAQLRLIKKKLGSSCQLLDIGCGAGYFLVYARSLGYDVEGVEPSNKLNTRTQEYRLTIHESIDSVLDQTRKYDVVTLFEVIEHIPPSDLSLFLRKVSSILAPGGIILGTTPNADSLNILISKEKDPAVWPPSHVSYFTRRSLFRLFADHGFEKNRLFTYGVIPFRSNKERPSFINQPNTGYLKIVSFLFRGLFYVAGQVIKIFNLNIGYTLAFVFQKTPV